MEKLALLAAVLLAQPIHPVDFGLAKSVPLKTLWAVEFPRDTPQAIAADARDRPFLFVTMKSGGLAVLKTARAGLAPKEIARIATTDLNGLDVMHLFQKGDRLYLALGDFFAAQGAKAGLAIVDVANPAVPKLLGIWTTAEKVHGAAVVVADDDFAYLGAMTQGVIILDVRKANEIRLVTTIQPDPQFPRKDPNRIQHPNARGLVLDGDRLFVAYDAGGIRILDVTNRQQPREVGRYINAAMGQKQQACNNLILDGDRLFAAMDYAGLEILNVKQVTAVRQIGWWNPWKADSIGNLWFNSEGHTNQLEYDPKKHLVYLSAGDSELRVVDISKPDRPELVGHVGQLKDGRGTWGVALGADAVYLTYMHAVVPFRGTWSGVIAVERP